MERDRCCRATRHRLVLHGKIHTHMEVCVLGTGQNRGTTDVSFSSTLAISWSLQDKKQRDYGLSMDDRKLLAGYAKCLCMVAAQWNWGPGYKNSPYSVLQVACEFTIGMQVYRSESACDDAQIGDHRIPDVVSARCGEKWRLVEEKQWTRMDHAHHSKSTITGHRHQASPGHISTRGDINVTRES